jgi:multidrug efflux pump subunit AcrB
MSDQNASDLEEINDADLGIAGRTARFFIKSPLSPMLYLAMLTMGIMGYLLIPRQEDPQISVPMVDLMVPFPGASAEKVSSLAIQPLERIMSEIPGVKHVYSASQRGMGLVTIQFEVGEEMGPSLVKVNDKLDSNKDKVPPGVTPPMVKAIGIDDVPAVTLTLWSKDLNKDGRPDVDDSQLRMLAQDVLQRLKEVTNTSKAFIIGGRKEVIKVEVLPEILAGYGISLGQVAAAIQASNTEIPVGSVESGGGHLVVVSGSFLKSGRDIGNIVVGNFNGSAVYVRDVARVVRGPEDATSLVTFTSGPEFPADEDGVTTRVDGAAAVTIAIAKKEGANGVVVARDVLNKVEELKGVVIPSNVGIFVTRNYGETARQKVNALMGKLFKATGFVFVLVLLAFRAFRPAIVVTLVIPVVLLMTIFFGWLMGMTIDRVSLFALIFSIGILVDDAIVVIENIYRRWLEKGQTSSAIAVDAVREVGNPTILATFTVIAALAPMGFVSGMMGPYMSPIPKLGSVAMAISLFAAFAFVPWLAKMKVFLPSMKYLETAEKREHRESENLEGLYVRILGPMIRHPAKRKLFNMVLWALMILACAMFYTKWVAVKMLPLDNKPEFSVILDMPDGTALPDTANVASMLAEKLRQMPEVTAIQTYVGTARPFDFNGMVRHYYLRQQPWQAEIQVQILDKDIRHHRGMRTSHEIAVQAREDLYKIIEGQNAQLSIVEMPPGPPVLQSVVAEVYGPTQEIRKQVAMDLTEYFKKAESLRDADNYLQAPLDYWRFEIDREKASLMGITSQSINHNLGMALGSQSLGDVKEIAGHEPVEIVLQLPFAERSQVSRLGDLPISTPSGESVPLRDLGHFVKMQEDDIIYRKDLRPIEYVVADVGGELASPAYGMLQVQDMLNADNYLAPDGVPLTAGFTGDHNIEWMGPPHNDSRSAFEWTGEWTVTYETFRDMGAAFMVALGLIYFLVVWEFGNFRIPAVIMAPIPLTLLGIIPAHGLLDAEFTATSMIGWIALAGIIVRNSILLMDFTIHQVRQGTHLEEAVIMACKTRTRPILITAFALVAGASVILDDPIFQGMAISLAAGVLVSTILTLIVIPLGTVKARKALYQVAGVEEPIGSSEFLAAQGGGSAADSTPGKSFGDYLLAGWSLLITVIMAIISIIGAIIGFIRRRLAKPETPPVEAKPAAGPQAPPAAPQPQPAAPPPVPVQKREAPSAEAAPPPEQAEALAREAAPQAPPQPETPVAGVAPPAAEPAATAAAATQQSPSSAAVDDILHTSQATIDDLDIISAPIRQGKSSAASKRTSATGSQGHAKDKQSGRRRRGIRLRDTSTDPEDGLN